MKDKVEVIEIWQETDGKDGVIYNFKKQKPMRLVALLVDGNPLKLIDSFIMERSVISEEEADRYLYAINSIKAGLFDKEDASIQYPTLLCAPSDRQDLINNGEI
jgi:hypothetical protein